MKDHESKVKEIEKQISDNSLEIQKTQNLWIYIPLIGSIYSTIILYT